MSDSSGRSDKNRLASTLPSGIQKIDRPASAPPPATPQRQSQVAGQGVELLYLLRCLNDDARTALAIGLGEALRLGTPWMGTEFLIMGLVRHPKELLAGYFEHIRMDPSAIRAAIRGQVPIQNKGWRHVRDVERLGRETLTELCEVDRSIVMSNWGTQEMPRAVITARLRLVLRKAVSLAKDEKVGPDHLLLALMDHRRSPAVQLLLSMVEPDATKPPVKLKIWIDRWRENPDVVTSAPTEVPYPTSEDVRSTDPAPPLAAFETSEASYLPPSPPAEAREATTPDLQRLGSDLFEAAEKGELRPAVGKTASETMVSLSSVLLQARASNPLLIGDGGVGKTSAVEGFAWRLAVGHEHGQPVAPQLSSWRVTALRPDFLALVSREVDDLGVWVQDFGDLLLAEQAGTIVFLDDVHSVLDARDAPRMLTLLELMLGRKDLPCVLSTTSRGYCQYIEPNGAVMQHLTPIWVKEPPVQEAIAIARTTAQAQLAPRHELHYETSAVEEAVRLSVRYLHDELLPGKAIKLLDQAGTSVLLSGSLGGASGNAASGIVTVDTLREIIASARSIPLTRLLEDDLQRLLRVEQELKRCVTGQDEAVEQVLGVIKRGKVGLSDPHRPLGVFLFAGSSGIGQLDLAMSLAETLYDERDAYLYISMGEYREISQISGLLGPQPGEGRGGEEGRLTGWLRRHPYGVVLLDEIERAHPEVQHLLLRFFDSGGSSDAWGSVDARNSIFVITTRLGTACRETASAGQPQRNSRRALVQAIEAELAPALIDRVDRIVCFRDGDQQAIMEVIENELTLLARRLRRQQGVILEATDDLKQALCSRYAGVPRGVRHVRRALDEVVEVRLADPLLAGELERDSVVRLDVHDLPHDPDDERGEPS